MNSYSKKIINFLCSELVLVKENNLLITNLKISEIKTKNTNGSQMTHADGSQYGLVFFEAISEKGQLNIKNAINQKPELPLEQLIEIIKEQRLWNWRPINHPKLTESKAGDLCTAMFIYDEKYDDYKVQTFKVKPK